MNKITDALLLKDTAPRSHIALSYGLIGLLLGVTIFGDRS